MNEQYIAVSLGIIATVIYGFMVHHNLISLVIVFLFVTGYSYFFVRGKK